MQWLSKLQAYGELNAVLVNKGFRIKKLNLLEKYRGGGIMTLRGAQRWGNMRKERSANEEWRRRIMRDRKRWGAIIAIGICTAVMSFMPMGVSAAEGQMAVGTAAEWKAEPGTEYESSSEAVTENQDGNTEEDRKSVV